MSILFEIAIIMLLLAICLEIGIVITLLDDIESQL